MFKKPANNTVITPVAYAGGAMFGSTDNLGRIRTSRHQNIYEADFEYGTQPMRWENFIVSPSGASRVDQLPGSGGVRMRLGTASGDATIRQTRPYHRYQPGKTMFMSTALNFGTAQNNQRQRVGFFDDGNGMFIEQGDPVFNTTTANFTGSSTAGLNIITNLSSTSSMYVGMPITGPNIAPSISGKDPNYPIAIPNTTVVQNIINSTAIGISSPATTTSVGTTYTFTTQANPFGMYTVIRSDVNATGVQNHGTNNGIPTDYRIPLPAWNGDQATIAAIDWTRIQMIWQEYTWYGAGMCRWGVVINGELIVLNYVGFGNKGPVNSSNPATGVIAYPTQVSPWARTGNLPVRYEQRNLAATSSQNDMYHWGVSVVVEGGQDEQRGFTYSYGMNPSTAATQRRTVPQSSTRYPVLSISSREMGVIEMSGNSTWNNTSAASTNSQITLVAANTKFDGVLASSLTANFSTTSNVITVTSGSTANVFVGQYVNSSAAGFPSGNPVVTYVNSSAYIINATPSGTATGATVNTYTQNTLVGRHIYFPGQGNNYGQAATTSNTGITARVTASNSTVITFGDIVTGLPIANTQPMNGTMFQIGLINRGQLLPKKMYISADATCIVELITSTTQKPILLTTSTSWNTLANLTYTQTTAGLLQQATGLTTTNTNPISYAGLGSDYSFAMRDVTSQSMSGGEVVFAFTAPAGGSGLQEIDLSYFFPLYNTVAGNLPDVLTVAVTTTSTAGSNVGVHIIAQEAMS